jgi:hypothetical protein
MPQELVHALLRFRSKGISHHIKIIDPGRLYEIAPETLLGTDPLYFVRVRAEDQKTIIELFILPIKYEVPLRDALAKCA